MRVLFRGVFSLVLMTALAVAPASAQSTSINGAIEGTVADDSGAVLPGVTVIITNVDTGSERVVVTNEGGRYRATTLPLGSYRIAAELQGFKKFEQSGFSVGAGQTAVINVTMGVGALTETVSVTAEAPVVDTARIEQGRTLNEQEIKTLPLTSRNPYNFALLQPGVVGYETQDTGVPRLTANGVLLRVNYQIDGNNNTQKDRAGLRQMPMSEVMIREVKVITTGYAPEFGQTTGLIYNAITPSGTNTFRGQGSYRFQRKDFAAFPFFFQGPRTDARKPNTDVDVFTVDLGGPIVRDKVHFFGGFENTKRDLSGDRVIGISPADAAAIGLPPQPGAIPAVGDTKFAIGKVDYQLTPNNRLTARYIFFDNFIAANVGATTSGIPNTVQVASDFSDRQHSGAAQLVTSLGSDKLNEFRIQYATRAQSRVPGADAGTGPSLRITGIANFGGPIPTNADAGFVFEQNVFQLLDNFTLIKGDHSLKLGFDAQWVDDQRTQTKFQLYTFPSIAAYNDARNGVNRTSYSSFQQFFGNADLAYESRLYGLFVQDDWRLTSDFKLLYGLRYDLYDVPDADASAPFGASRSYAVDKNNWGPRGGIVWALGEDRRTVVRANSGIMFDQPLLATYERALQEDGSSTRVTVSVQPANAGAPAFPATLDNTPPGFVLPRQSISTVDPDFHVARTWQNNVQLERGIGDHYSAAVGFSYTRGYDLPVITNVNPINPIGALSDGRPIYSTTINAATRLDPTFNNINMVQSIGDSEYKALMLQVTRRFTRGIQFDMSYTLGKSSDNAPLTTILSVQGDAGREDPSNLERDRGPHILDQRHTFIGSIVAKPSVDVAGVLGAILNNNQFGIAIQLASGIPINVRSNRELNNDGVASDRPIDVGRNSLSLPARKNVDLRYSRVFPVAGTMNIECIIEAKNIFNTVQVASVNSTVATDERGVPLAAIPTDGDAFTPTAGYERRQVQIGLRVTF